MLNKLNGTLPEPAEEVKVMEFPTPKSDCSDEQSTIYYDNLRKYSTRKFEVKHLFNSSLEASRFRTETARYFNAAMVLHQKDLSFTGLTTKDFVRYFGCHVGDVLETEGEYSDRK